MSQRTGASDDGPTEQDGDGTVRRPPRPELYVGSPPPRLTPPEPPGAQRAAAGAWKIAAACLGLSLALFFLDLGGRREHLRSRVVDRAPGATETTLERTIDIVFWGGVGAWGLVAVLALVVSSGLLKPRVGPRVGGVLLALLTATAVVLTVVLLVPGDGPGGIAARGVLVVGAAAAAVGALLGLLPPVWRWIKDHRHD
ncbi:hypothetical protein [uncultured Ornithinimicrobium sp.]|uniref:hypothetical protein n=1 Tax=uncultured Ornithinimicrobium sp. TaxID=259307 RepID=UPI0025950544|nr:hypothetical protein [uncultured Ornithinimicrobium sp.]